MATVSKVQSSTGPGDGQGESDAKDSWFGQKYFQCMVAHRVIAAQTTYGQQSQDLDALYDLELLAFDHEKCLKSLYENGIIADQAKLGTGGRDAAEDCLMNCIGKIIRTGTPTQKRGLFTTLGGKPPLRAEDLDHEPPVIAMPVPSLKRTFDDLEDMARYTMALHEFATQCSTLLNYEYSQITLFQPLFLCTLTFRGITYEGEARSKKTAKHIASRNACEAVGVRVI